MIQKSDWQESLSKGIAGDSVGILLRGINKEEIQRGMVIAKPGSILPHSSFEAEVYILTKEEGGRPNPFFTGYRPQFYVRTTDVTGTILAFKSDDGDEPEMVMPGDLIKMAVEFICPIAIEPGMRFAIRAGRRTIGAGVVSKILTHRETTEIKNRANKSNAGRANTSAISDYSSTVSQSSSAGSQSSSPGWLSSLFLPKNSNQVSDSSNGRTSVSARQENEIQNLIEYKETSNSSSSFEVSFGTNGQITKFIFNPQLQEPISYLQTTVYSILEQLRTSWNQYYRNSSVGNLLEEKTEEITGHRQEEIGYIIVRLIATLANFSYQQAEKKLDHMSIDAQIQNQTTGDLLSIQIKTTKSLQHNKNGDVKYALEIKNYNDLRKRKNPTIIVVVEVPKVIRKSQTYGTNYLEIIGSCNPYWIATNNWEEVENETSKTIYIPRSQIFDVNTLEEIMAKIDKGESL